MPHLIDAHIEHLHTLAPSVLQVFLKPHTYIPYEAGQYLEIIHSKTAPLFYSIANAPFSDTHYELHVRTVPTMPLLQSLQLHHTLRLCLPFGQCTVSTLRSDKPLIFIAGGTGFAPLKAMIEDLEKQTPKRTMTLIWACKTADQLYMHTEMQALAQHAPHFEFIPCITSHFSLHAILRQHSARLRPQDAEIILAGPFEMVYAVRDELLQHGVMQQHMHADAFTPI